MTTEFGLNSILRDPFKNTDLHLAKSHILTDFNYERTFSINGKFSVDFSVDLADVDLEGCNSVTVRSYLGEINKEDVDIPKLIDTLKSRQENVALTDDQLSN